MNAVRPALRVAVLLSGAGNTLAALLAANLPVQWVQVISDRSDAAGLSVAAQAGVLHACLERDRFPSRSAFEVALALALEQAEPDLIVLAGFMRVLSERFVQRFANKMINLHPSLLPKFPGLDTHQRALDAGEHEHGASVHWVSAELDAGPLIAQERMAIAAGDTAQSLQARLKPIEQGLLARVISVMAENWQLHGQLSRSPYEGRV